MPFLRWSVDTPKDDVDLAYGRYRPVYTEMELLDIYQDLLNTQVQAPPPVEPSADEFEEQEDDRTSVHSLIERLNEYLPPEPGTSQSHAVGVDLQGDAVNYRRAVSQLATILEDTEPTVENPAPSSPQLRAGRQVLPSLLEWAALIRECVSVLPQNNPFADFFPPDPGEGRGIRHGVIDPDKGSSSPGIIVVGHYNVVAESRIRAGR